MRPQAMPVKTLAHFLRQVADEVEKNASAEGTISYAWAGLGDWYGEPPEDIGEDEILVSGAVRNGNDMGQGGMWVLGAMDEIPNPVLDHANDELTSTQQITQMRATDTRHRMRRDLGTLLGSEFPMLSAQVAGDLAERLTDNGMFYVEHLLAELERRPMPTPDEYAEAKSVPDDA